MTRGLGAAAIIVGSVTMFAAYGQQEPAKPTQSEPAKPETGPGQEKQPKTELEAGYDGGFYIRGKDVKFTIEGVLQMNAVAFEPGGPHASEFVLRRVRPEFSGEFFGIWRFPHRAQILVGRGRAGGGLGRSSVEEPPIPLWPDEG